MKLKWKGNQRYNEDISKATILELNDELRVSIHKLMGCGEGIYLSCYPLNISRESLYTEDWDVAEERAIKRLQEKAKNLYDLTMKLNKDC